MKSLLPLLATLMSLSPALAETHTLWIGSSGGEAKGIYRATFDSATGKLSKPELAHEMAGTGFVVTNEAKTRLYSLCAEDKGSVAAFSIGADGALTRINTQPIGDGTASHLSLDRSGRILFTAQYGAGSIASFPVNEDGSIAPRASHLKHSGSGPNPARQEGPHPHWVGTSPDNRFLFVPDLGLDEVKIYAIDHATATLREHGRGVAVPGSGPRHLKFSPDGGKIYVVNELDMTVTVYDYDAAAGTMGAIQSIPTLPESEWKVPNKASEIRIHPSGRFLYAANRGHDSIAVFTVHPGDGKLTFVEREAVRGAYPRNFNLDPTGRWLLAAGRLSNTIAVFEIEPETGVLLFTNEVVNTPSPICLEW